LRLRSRNSPGHEFWLRYNQQLTHGYTRRVTDIAAESDALSKRYVDSTKPNYNRQSNP